MYSVLVERSIVLYSSAILVLCVWQVTLTFVVYDWDGPLIGDDLLGAAKLALGEVS